MLMGLPAVARAFRAANPAARLTLRELSTAPQLVLLAEGAIDIAVTSTARRRRDLVRHHSWRDPLAVVLPAAHPVAASGAPVPLAALAGEPFVLFPATHAPEQHGEILAACAKAGFVPEIVQEAEGWHAVLSLVSAGLGVTIAPSAVARLNVPDIVLRPIAGRTPFTSLALCTRRGPPSPTLAAFLALAHLWG
jgi:DNA-binding transcriptional LysR family regulator